MSDQASREDFITTIKELMRLTREGVLDWSVDYSSDPSVAPSDYTRPDIQPRFPTYKSEYDNLEFIIEDAAPYQSQKLAPKAFGVKISDRNTNLTPGSKFRIRIKDKEDSSIISSPPMKQVRDLVSVI